MATPSEIQAVRDYMLRITFTAKQEDHQPEADVLNKLVPIIVSQITDDEIEEALKAEEFQLQADSWPSSDGLGSGNLLRQAVLGKKETE